MPQSSNHAMQATFVAPQITNADLHGFHEAHFSDAAIQEFGQHFLSPSAGRDPSAAAADGDDCQDDDDDDDDDGLGYYPDGVKRTLTDEQIAMFRHSELQNIHRNREKEYQSRQSLTVSTSPVANQATGTIRVADIEEREPTRQSKSKKKKGGRPKKQEPKPDLRKRTWDVVESGLDTLSYDE